MRATVRSVQFLLVYIREAHADGSWQSTRNIRDGVTLAPATSLSAKHEHAAMCSRTLHLPFPSVVDGMDDAVERAYNAWPSRAFIVGMRWASHVQHSPDGTRFPSR